MNPGVNPEYYFASPSLLCGGTLSLRNLTSYYIKVTVFENYVKSIIQYSEQSELSLQF